MSEDGNGWSHQVATVTPGIPGDSDSAFIDKQGRALGVLSTLEVAPVPASNGVGDLSKELQYLAAHTSFNVTLATGTEPFRGPLLPASRRRSRSRHAAAAPNASRRRGRRRPRAAAARRGCRRRSRVVCWLLPHRRLLLHRRVDLLHLSRLPLLRIDTPWG